MKTYREVQRGNSKPMAIIKNGENKENGEKEKKGKYHNIVGYSLTTSLIDPANFSPPNMFLDTLKKRMTIYEDFSKKVERREIE
uniref:Uncharacterized protein n=1 Tax=viral metagenome TaxID=1070528 RepID=A0A6C0B8T9_9ZZZZ